MYSILFYFLVLYQPSLSLGNNWLCIKMAPEDDLFIRIGGADKSYSVITLRSATQLKAMWSCTFDIT